MNFDSDEEVKVAIVGFVGVGPIDLGSDSDDDMMTTTLGIIGDGPIDLGFDSTDEINIVADFVPKMRRALKTTWL